ncbi:MAG: Hsp20/alpha crystallin family protein [Bacteroidota bacterium]
MKVNPRNRSVFSTFDSLLNELFDDKLRPFAAPVKAAIPFNLIETDNGFRLELAVPGLSKEDIQINIDKDILKVSAKKEYKEAEGEKVLRRGFGAYEFDKTFHLPKTVDTDQINASFENGVLSIGLAKKETAIAKPARNIEIA